MCSLGVTEWDVVWMVPRSTGRPMPVMYRDASEARKSTAALTSSGSTYGTGIALWS